MTLLLYRMGYADVIRCGYLNTRMHCAENQLTGLDVSKNTSLTELYCYINSLTSLDVSKNTALSRMHCGEDQLTTLNLGSNTSLTELTCYKNDLTSLDVSGCTSLKYLNCHSNQLTSLDVSGCTSLTGLTCYHNYLTHDTLIPPDGIAFGNTLTVPQYQKINTSTASYAKNFDDAAFDLGATAQSDITYESDNPNVATVDTNGKVTITGVGTATITISAVWDFYYVSAEKTVTVTVNPAAQTITTSAASYTKYAVDPAFGLGAKAKTALTYVSSNPSVASVSSTGKVTPKKAGTANITITAPANANYKAATKTVKVTVLAVAQTISAHSSFVKTYGDPAFNIGAKAKTALTYKSSNPGVAAVSANGTISLKNAGEATITITASSTSQYKAATKTVKITVKPAATKLTGIAPAARGFTITWNKVSSADGYYIARSVNGGAYKIIRNIAANGSVKAAGATLSYTDTTALTNGAKYSYKIMTYKVSGKNVLRGAYSNIKSYYRLSQPFFTRAVNCCKGRISVKISRNPKASGYQLICSHNNFATYGRKTLAGNNNTAFTIPNLAMNTLYSLQARSYLKIGNVTYYSAWSPVRTIKTTNTCPNHLCG